MGPRSGRGDCVCGVTILRAVEEHYKAMAFVFLKFYQLLRFPRDWPCHRTAAAKVPKPKIYTGSPPSWNEPPTGELGRKIRLCSASAEGRAIVFRDRSLLF